MKIPHVHIHDRVIFRTGYSGGLEDGYVTMITERGLHIRQQYTTVFKKWDFIKEIIPKAA